MKSINVTIKDLWKKIYDLNWPFILLLFILIFIDWRNWIDSAWPGQDGLSCFHIFYAYYNELFFEGHLLRWLPYGSFGLPGDFFQMFCLSPGSYLAAVLGALFRIQNVFLVFKFSVFLDQLALLLGTYLFSRQIFRHKSTAFFVALGVIGSSVWLNQLNWNFRIYYRLPLILYFLTVFFKYQKPRYFWLSGTICMISLIGGCTYWIALYLPMLFLFTLVLFIKNRLLVGSIFERTRDNFLFFSLFVISSFVILYFSANMLNNIAAPNMLGRDPLTHLSTSEGFLKIGYTIGLDKFRGYLFAWSGLGNDNTLYIGLLPLLFLLYAVICVRNTVFVAVGVVILFLGCLTVGDVAFVARNLFDFFFPIRVFHYIGSIGALISLFFLFAAGFGFDHFLSSLKQNGSDSCDRNVKYLNYCGIALFCLFLFLDLKKIGGDAPSKLWQEFGYFSFAMIGAALLFLNGPKNTSRFAGLIVISFLALELLSYQNLFSASWRFKFPWAQSAATHVHDYAYQKERQLWTEEARFDAIRTVAEAGDQRFAVEMFNYYQFDPCGARMYYNNQISQGVDELTDRRWHFFHDNQVIMNPMRYTSDPQAEAIFKVVGCYSSKMKLLTDVAYAANHVEAQKLVEALPDFGNKFVIEGAAPDEAVAMQATNISAGTVNVTEFTYNSVKIEVDVTSETGAWLYYADAYHPGWHAKINGKTAPIRRANLAFKAIHLKRGKQVVQLRFSDGLQGLMSHLIAIIGLAFSVIVLYGIFACARTKVISFPET